MIHPLRVSEPLAGPLQDDPRRSPPSSPSTSSPAPRRARRRVLTVAGAIATALLLGGCQVPGFWGLKGSTTQAQNEHHLWVGISIASIVVGGIVTALILWAVFRYRRRSDAMPRQFQYHVPLEITYTLIPLAIVLVIFGFTFVSENQVDAIAPNPAIRVNVTAFQWGWRFDYYNKHVSVEGALRQNPDAIGLNGKTCEQSVANPDDCWGPGLVVPAGQTTEIHLRSNDVIHSFYVPDFNFSRYAQPGIENDFDLTVLNAGIYRGQCNEICGLYHSQMYFHVVALPMAQFDRWISGNLSGALAGTGPVSDATAQPNVSGLGQNAGLPPAQPSNYPPVVEPPPAVPAVVPPTSTPSPAATTSPAAAAGTPAPSPTTSVNPGGPYAPAPAPTH